VSRPSNLFSPVARRGQITVAQGVLDETDSGSRVRILEDEVKRYQVGAFVTLMDVSAP